MPLLKRILTPFNCRNQGLVPGPPMWNSYGQWQMDRSPAEYFGFPLSVSFHKCSIRNQSSVADAKYS